MMKPHKLQTIEYSKVLEEGSVETTQRDVVPVTVPGNIKAIDVTDFDLEKQYEIADSYGEYAEYLSGHIKVAFSFEDWLSHTKSVDFTPKYRTFKPEQTVERATLPRSLVK